MRYRRSAVPGARYFFTLVTHQRARLFEDAANIDKWRLAVEKVRQRRAFCVEAEVVLPDHIHIVWTLPEGDADFPTRIRLVKTAFTKMLTAGRSDDGVSVRRDVWQSRYWEHLVRDERDFKAHVDYIHLNPVKHGLVESPGDWPHSTFGAWVERGAYDAWWGSDAMPPLPEWVGNE